MEQNTKNIRVLIVGCGNMGTSHALAYQKIPGFEICGIVSRGKSKEELNKKLGGGFPLFENITDALAVSKPDAVCISTYPDTHFEFGMKSLEAGCHLFMEKPLADTVDGAQELIDTARQKNKKIVVGYILRHHPSWKKFISISKGLGKPLVMRMNLNQQSSGATWYTHLNLMKSMSPILDCGVHYVDVMCQMTEANPLRVSAIGARLTEEVSPDMYNYGQLQITFDDGSVGWYEAGWGPMMSETAYFIKDVIGPKGSVSIASQNQESDSVESHTKSSTLLLHHAQMNKEGNFAKEDEWIHIESEPDHNELCLFQQQYFLQSIREDEDLTSHLNDALNSLRIVFAADKSIKTGQTVSL